MNEAKPKTKRFQRRCVACGKAGSKGDLLRLVRNADGTVDYDPTGRRNGRGAYVCSRACLATMQKTKKLDRALRVKLKEGDLARLDASLPPTPNAESYE